ncbi:MAG: 4Fe-4S binding protein [Bacteroidales bacterium]|nr:4Fe-4S binding protein [Bacteroidales bacterium]
MLKKLRITLAIICFTMITLLFLDFTGTLHAWFGWMAKLQFVPALLASGSITVLAIIIVTMTFGRIYCSILCPLGVYQDGISRMAEKRKKNRYKFKKSRKWLRYSILLVFAVFLFVGLNSIAILIAPYSIYGRIASNLFAPLYQLINNVLAYFAERWDSYAFYHVDVYIKSLPIFIVSIAYFLIITILSLTNGRWYCNTVCPVGTILGFFARGSLFKPVIDTEKCNSCGLCERNCRCSAIDSKNHKIDYTKCVTCFNCIEKCHQGAMRYRLAGNIDNVNKVKTIGDETKDGKTSRKTFIATVATLAAASTLKAQEKVVDGGLATIEKKKAPKRETPIKPAGSVSLDNFSSRCTGCQLCVQVCPNDVLRASSKLDTFMQPEMSYERGYCRPECTKCSEVCPAGAITKVTREQKTAIQIGHAVWIGQNCVPLRDGVSCGNCAKHCPSGAITMMPYDPEDATSPLIPTINTEKCIGCGACEHVCPARPFSAIFVEGNVTHIII